jgi:hypothetical protein
MGPLGREPRFPMRSGGVEREMALGQSGVLPLWSHRWCRRVAVVGRRGGVPARRILLAQPSLFRPFKGGLLMRPRDGIAGCPFAPSTGRTNVDVSPPRGACIHPLGTGSLSRFATAGRWFGILSSDGVIPLHCGRPRTPPFWLDTRRRVVWRGRTAARCSSREHARRRN